MPKPVGLEVPVRDEQIEVAIAVIIAPGRTGVIPQKGDKRAAGNLVEGPVTIIFVEADSFTADIVPAGNDYINVAIVVVIAPGKTFRISNIRGNNAIGDPGKGAILIVMVEKVFLIVSIDHEQIDPAVVIKIGPACAFGSSAVIDDTARGDLGKCRVHRQQRLAAGVRPERVAHNDAVTLTVVRQRNIGDAERPICRPRNVLPVQTPLVSKRRRAKCANTERHIGTQTY